MDPKKVIILIVLLVGLVVAVRWALMMWSASQGGMPSAPAGYTYGPPKVEKPPLGTSLPTAPSPLNEK